MFLLVFSLSLTYFLLGSNYPQMPLLIQILTAKDYALILGMPGTGKTSTMVHAVKALLMRGASILLTSYTNSAVDNLLIKLKAQVRLPFIHLIYRLLLASTFSISWCSSIKTLLFKATKRWCLGRFGVLCFILLRSFSNCNRVVYEKTMI